MSQEIIDAVRDIEREKGIEGGTLVAALEDALLAAYKKTPGASRHATVEIDDQGDFRVYSIELPPDVEERLLDEARERALEELLPRSEQVDGERYEQGSRIKAVITEVRSGTKGPQVILSRRDPELIKTLFELEVPEIADGLVEFCGVAAHQELAKIEAETGEYAPGTVTPTSPEPEESAEEPAEEPEPVAEQGEEAPVEPAETDV